MLKPTGDLDALIESIDWRQPRAANYANRAHINIQKVLAASEEISRRAASGDRNKRIVTIFDSRVAVGPIRKGRSSSILLNMALRGFMWIFCLYGLSCARIWCGAKSNPADAPSRGASLPIPGPRPGWSVRLSADNAYVGLQADYGRGLQSLVCMTGWVKKLQAKEYHVGVGGLALYLRFGVISGEVFEYNGPAAWAHANFELDTVI